MKRPKAKPGTEGDFSIRQNLVRAKIYSGSWPKGCGKLLPKLIGLSPTLAEALAEIERTIQKIERIQSFKNPQARSRSINRKGPAQRRCTSLLGGRASRTDGGSRKGELEMRPFSAANPSHVK